MKNIKEVRQELDYIFCQLESDETNCEVQRDRNKLERCLKCDIPKSRNVLDQFITDVEELIKDHTQLETDYNNLLSSNSLEIEKLEKENEELRKQAIEMRDNFQETIRERNYNGERFNTLHDSQAIEPSVLEKIDKLEKENEQYRNSNKQVYEELKKTIKQLAITDKALDKVCNMLYKEYSVYNSPQELKDYLLKESEKEQ